MRSEEYLLLAEIEYWQEMIETRKCFLSRRAIDEMVQSQAQAKRRLASLREKSNRRRDYMPDVTPVFAN